MNDDTERKSEDTGAVVHFDIGDRKSREFISLNNSLNNNML